MMTRMHTVVDIFCMGCGSIVGWKYEATQDKSQKYKEGKFILESVSTAIKNLSFKRLYFEDRSVYMHEEQWEGTREMEGGKHYAIWDDPFKKPSYLLHCLLDN